MSEEFFEEVQNIGEGNNIGFVSFFVDEESCRCANNEEIVEFCLCGGEIYFEGYCCFG